MNARVPEPLLLDASARAALHAAFGRAWSKHAPPPEMTIIEWAERYRVMSPEETSTPGQYSLEMTPVLRGILAAASRRDVRKLVVQKSAQVGYTAGVVCNVLGYHVHWRPSVQVVMFPREKSAKDFAAEKFEPMVRATPVLAERIPLKSRAAGQGTQRRSYPGGLLKLVASNSPSDVKSTSGRIGIVEEPDDTNVNVAGQGNAIVLLGERTKTYAPDDLQLIGGTPTAKSTSLIVKEMRDSDQSYFQVPCHHCDEAHALQWDNVIIPGLELGDDDKALPREQLDAKWPEREVYGRARWEDAYYVCPHCGCPWTDDERIENIRRAARQAPGYGWQATAPSQTPGFFLSELLSVFDGSRLPLLARKYLVARSEYERGEPEKLIAFTNASLGLPWEYRGELPEEDELRERALPYEEWSCPAGGLVPVMFVDVQHDRLAVTVYAVGRGEEMWLVHWGEVYGRTIVPMAGAWIELEQLMQRRVRHASGATVAIRAVGIDSGDGQTSDAVYEFVRRHHHRARPVLATKGASDSVGRVEILTKARPIEVGKKSTKAAARGVHIHIIGAAKAKDLVLGWAQEGGRVRLQGHGPGRMHWYQGVRDDFYEQLLGEMKVPSRHNPRVREWVERNDRRNEALDCTVGCLWLSRYLKLHLMHPRHWQVVEGRLLQVSLVDDDQVPGGDDDDQADQPEAPKADPEPPKAANPPPPPAPQPPIAASTLLRAARRRRGVIGAFR